MKKSKILLITVLMVLMLASSSLALNELGTFKSGEDINLLQLCSSCTYNNITSVTSPNSEILVSNVAMTKTGSEYNYSLNSSYTSSYGTYKVNGIGDLDGEDTIWVYTFEVTPSGTIPTTAQGLLYAILLIVLIVLLVFSILGAFKIDGKNKFTMGGNIVEVNFNKYYKMGLGFLSYLFLIFISFVSYSISLLFMDIGFTTAILKTINQILWILLAPVFLAFVIIALIKFTLDMKLEKLGERNLKPRNK